MSACIFCGYMLTTQDMCYRCREVYQSLERSSRIAAGWNAKVLQKIINTVKVEEVDRKLKGDE